MTFLIERRIRWLVLEQVRALCAGCGVGTSWKAEHNTSALLLAVEVHEVLPPGTCAGAEHPWCDVCAFGVNLEDIEGLRSFRVLPDLMLCSTHVRAMVNVIRQDEWEHHWW